MCICKTCGHKHEAPDDPEKKKQYYRLYRRMNPDKIKRARDKFKNKQKMRPSME